MCSRLGACCTLPTTCYTPKHPELVDIHSKIVSVLNYATCREDVWGNGGTAPRIVNFGTRWRGMISFTLLPLYLRVKSPWYPLDRRLGGTQSRSGRGGEDRKKVPAPARNQTQVVQSISQSLYWLSYRGLLRNILIQVLWSGRTREVHSVSSQFLTNNPTAAVHLISLCNGATSHRNWSTGPQLSWFYQNKTVSIGLSISCTASWPRPLEENKVSEIKSRSG
jgi:hypothetical protein